MDENDMKKKVFFSTQNPLPTGGHWKTANVWQHPM